MATLCSSKQRYNSHFDRAKYRLLLLVKDYYKIKTGFELIYLLIPYSASNPAATIPGIFQPNPIFAPSTGPDVAIFPTGCTSNYGANTVGSDSVVVHMYMSIYAPPHSFHILV
jgi:hypothetical protein